MKKVYFYLIFNEIGVYEYEYEEYAWSCTKSPNFNSIEEAFESKELQGENTSPIMVGWIKEQ